MKPLYLAIASAIMLIAIYLSRNTRFWTCLQESDGSWSWARLGASVTLLTSVYGFLHVVMHNHAIPDAATLAGLAAWAVAPYAVNKSMTAFAKKDNQL